MPRYDLYTQSDLPALRTLLDAYLRELMPGEDPADYWDGEYFDSLRAGLEAGTHTIWLARVDAELAGFSLVHIAYHWYRRSTSTGVIDDIYVAPDHRRDGLGASLARRGIATLRTYAVTSISASVLRNNLGGLLFWQRLGFSIEGYHLYLRDL